jgi:hypothetical protein
MKTIHKFHIAANDYKLVMPVGARILSVHEQHNGIFLWAMVDDSNAKEIRQFRYFGTGHEMPDDAMQFLGTVHLDAGNFVFHVFEVM